MRWRHRRGHFAGAITTRPDPDGETADVGLERRGDPADSTPQCALNPRAGLDLSGRSGSSPFAIGTLRDQQHLLPAYVRAALGENGLGPAAIDERAHFQGTLRAFP